MKDAIWFDVKETLQGTLGANNFKNWIEPLDLHDLSGGIATFHVPTNFFGNYVSQNFGDQIL